MTKISIDMVKEQLARKGIRLSYQRLKVLELMHERGGHPTVDEIFGMLSPDIPSLAKATVYNTVHTLVDAGLVKIVDIDGTEKRYDMILTDHGHFLCKTCGTIYNFEIDIDQIPFQGLDKFVVSQKNVTFRGLCPGCLQESQERK